MLETSSMDELVAFGIFGSYFALIGACFIGVFVSILSNAPQKDKVLSGRPFVFLRAGFGGLLCTWYFMIQFMKWSYNSYASAHPGATMGDWLVGTSLFEQAWRAVCVGEANWWWSSWICTSAVMFTALIWYQTIRRGIKYPAIYMLLGQLVAISVAIALYLTAVYLHPPLQPRKRAAATPVLFFCLVGALGIMIVLPQYSATSMFMPALGAIHVAVVIPLLMIPKEAAGPSAVPYKVFIPILLVLAAMVHYVNTLSVRPLVSDWRYVPMLLRDIVLTHAAQASVSLDVVWVAITFTLWYVVKGSATSIVLKAVGVLSLVLLGAARYFGVNWWFIASVLPIVGLLLVGSIGLLLKRVRDRNARRRAELLGDMGILEYGVIPGTELEPPQLAEPRPVVGFWHPYCNAGGGGERVLWTAIAWLQRERPDVVILVYSGDYPAASKEEILAKVKERFSINLAPEYLAFVPLPSRHLISDTYWRRFTLLSQSLGSVYLAWEGLCGPNGVWGDIFIDSMGYGFVLPFVRLVTGSETAIGAYTHYPTVSTDMVKRVRERRGGVEDGGASKSALRTQVKLIYYRIFTSLYATALLFSEYTMTNSSWTQAHIQDLLRTGRGTWLASLLLMDEASVSHRRERAQQGAGAYEPAAKCEVVYPPCDTAELVRLGKLDKRAGIVSLAQFRPEKEHAKQLYALSILLKEHPEHRAEDVHLTLMGGVRGAADEARVEALKQLAQDLGISPHVTFLVNAPYPQIVERLGQASLGLNTMQDEHFGINVVEFMAAGIIPIVHASAGPLLDIVVPYEGKRTGLHATDAQGFASAMHEALGMSRAQQRAMREAARALAESKFSQAAFEDGFARGWAALEAASGHRRSE